MRRRSWPERAFIGLAAGAVGALTMNLYARAIRNLRGGREAEGVAPGADRDGRGMQPPQADGAAADDASVQIGRAGYRAISGEEPDRRLAIRLGSAAHYAFGAACGAAYLVSAEGMPTLRSGFGSLYGLAIWAVADEGMMPALNLSRGPRELPWGVHAYSVGGHLVWGMTLEWVCRLAGA